VKIKWQTNPEMGARQHPPSLFRHCQ